MIKKLSDTSWHQSCDMRGSRNLNYQAVCGSGPPLDPHVWYTYNKMTNVEVAYLHELKVKMSFPDKKNKSWPLYGWWFSAELFFSRNHFDIYFNQTWKKASLAFKYVHTKNVFKKMNKYINKIWWVFKDIFQKLDPIRQYM